MVINKPSPRMLSKVPPVGAPTQSPGDANSVSPAAGTGSPASGATSPNSGMTDLLAYGRDNNIPRPGAMTGMTPVNPSPALSTPPVPLNGAQQSPATGLTPVQPSAAPAQAVPPAPPPQTERVNPLTGDNSKVVPGQSTSFTPPPALHVGGQGSYMQGFSNPHSAQVYYSYVKGLFNSGSTGSQQKTPLRRVPTAQPAYAGE